MNSNKYNHKHANCHVHGHFYIHAVHAAIQILSKPVLVERKEILTELICFVFSIAQDMKEALNYCHVTAT